MTKRNRETDKQREVRHLVTDAISKGETNISGDKYKAAYISTTVSGDLELGMYKGYDISVNCVDNSIIYIKAKKQTPGNFPDNPYWQIPIPQTKSGNVDFDTLFKQIDILPNDAYISKVPINIKHAPKVTGKLRY